ncbi:MAG: DUF1326 domain-containing protein [Actinomycetota bacterium]
MRDRDYLPWAISGTYLEACNCEAICPCRTIGGRKGGRSTYGVCLGSLSWSIEEGHAGEVSLEGLRVVLANRYDDDEPGSPWSFFLYLDERAEDRQREALEGIFVGRLGGTPELQFPWVWKPSDLLGVRSVAIEVDHTPGGGWFRAGNQVSVRIRQRLDPQEPVTCVIPGHRRDGNEVVAELLEVRDGKLEFEFTGKCGYEATFAYSSEDA